MWYLYLYLRITQKSLWFVLGVYLFSWASCLMYVYVFPSKASRFNTAFLKFYRSFICFSIVKRCLLLLLQKKKYRVKVVSLWDIILDIYFTINYIWPLYIYKSSFSSIIIWPLFFCIETSFTIVYLILLLNEIPFKRMVTMLKPFLWWLIHYFSSFISWFRLDWIFTEEGMFPHTFFGCTGTRPLLPLSSSLTGYKKVRWYVCWSSFYLYRFKIIFVLFYSQQIKI